MDFGIGSIISGGLGFMGQMENADAQREATQANFALGVYNAQNQDRWREEQIAMANKLRGEQKLGSTDIRGTRTQFIPGQGWVTSGSPAVLAMMKAQDAEQMKVLSHDLPMRRAAMDRNYTRGLGDDALADTFRRQLTNTAPPRSDAAYANDLYTAQTTPLLQAANDAGRSAWTYNMRTGNNSAAGDVAAGLQREKNQAYASAGLNAKLMARGMGVKEQMDRKNSLSNLYNLFATRAGALPDVSYKPQPIDTTGTLSQSMQGDLTTGALAAQSYGKAGGLLDYVPPNMGYGNAIAGLGSSLGSAFRTQAARDAYQGNQGGSGGITGFGSSGGGGDGGGMYLTGSNDPGNSTGW